MERPLSLIAYLLLVPNSLKDNREYLSTSMWTDRVHKGLVRGMMELYDATGRSPGHAALCEYIEAKYVEQKALREKLLDATDYAFERDPRELEAIHAEGLKKMLLQHSYFNALEAMADCVMGGRMEEASRIWAQAGGVATGDKGYDYFLVDNIEARTDPEALPYNRKGIVPTGYESMDWVMKGGAGEGELWAVAGRPNRGKSRFVQNLAARALCMGKKVYLFTFEMANEVVVGRIDQILLGCSVEECQGHVARATLTERLARLRKKGAWLNVKHWPEYSSNMADVEAYVMKMGVKPDMIITDYLDLMLPGKDTGNYWENQRMLFAEGRRAAVRLECCHWTVLQPKVLDDPTEIITGERLGGSYGKMHTLDGGWSINAEDEDESKSLLYGFKNRYGVRGKYIPMIVEGETLRVKEREHEDG